LTNYPEMFKAKVKAVAFEDINDPAASTWESASELKKAKAAMDDARRVLSGCRAPVSLDQPISAKGEDPRGEFLPDYREDNPLEKVHRDLLRTRIASILDLLSWRERSVLQMRFGLGDGFSYTLRDISQVFRVSRERIRQIETKAFEKLRESEHSVELSAFLDSPVRTAADATGAPSSRDTAAQSTSA
jgi:RNA polymerase primary sigma factor